MRKGEIRGKGDERQRGTGRGRAGFYELKYIIKIFKKANYYEESKS